MDDKESPTLDAAPVIPENAIIPLHSIEFHSQEHLDTAIDFNASKIATYQGKQVVVKSLFKSKDDSIDMFQMMDVFMLESAKLKQIKHERIIRFYGFVMYALFSSVTEQAGPLGTLYHYIQDNPKMAWTERASVALDIAEGMAYLHRRSVMVDQVKYEVCHQALYTEHILLDMDIDTHKLRAKIAYVGMADLYNNAKVNGTRYSLTSRESQLVEEQERCELKRKKAYQAPEYDIKKKASFMVPSHVSGQKKLLTLHSPESAKDHFLPWPPSGILGIPRSYSHCLKGCFDAEPHHRPNFDKLFLYLQRDYKKISMIDTREFIEKTHVQDYLELLKTSKITLEATAKSDKEHTGHSPPGSPAAEIERVESIKRMVKRDDSGSLYEGRRTSKADSTHSRSSATAKQKRDNFDKFVHPDTKIEMIKEYKTMGRHRSRSDHLLESPQASPRQRRKSPKPHSRTESELPSLEDPLKAELMNAMKPSNSADIPVKKTRAMSHTEGVAHRTNKHAGLIRRDSPQLSAMDIRRKLRNEKDNSYPDAVQDTDVQVFQNGLVGSTSHDSMAFAQESMLSLKPTEMLSQRDIISDRESTKDLVQPVKRVASMDQITTHSRSPSQKNLQLNNLKKSASTTSIDSIDSTQSEITITANKAWIQMTCLFSAIFIPTICFFIIALATLSPASVPVTRNDTLTQPSCGLGNRGNGVCANPLECCSPSGWCAPMTNCTVFTNRFCGNGIIGNGTCQESSKCCNTFGFCGLSEDFCTMGKCLGAICNYGTTLPCGNGRVNSGRCADPTQCCSSDGYCRLCYCGNGNIGNKTCSNPTQCCNADGICGTGLHCRVNCIGGPCFNPLA